MAEPADQAHAVHLAGLLFEAADEQHVAVELEERLGRRVDARFGVSLAAGLGFVGCGRFRHEHSGVGVARSAQYTHKPSRPASVFSRGR